MTFRRTATILSETAPESGTGEPYGLSTTAIADAGLILTAAVVGFTASRLVTNQPVELVYDKPGDEVANRDAVDLVRRTLTASSVLPLPDGAVDAVTVSAARPWEKAALITGAAGAARTQFAARNAVPTAEQAETLRQIAADQAEPLGYQGAGAYTGLLDDPVRRSGSVTSTIRSNVPPQGFGDRWLPPAYTYQGAGNDQGTQPWGLLLTPEGHPIPGIKGPDPDVPGIVGYTHGMVQMVYSAVAEGPWCTPFEIAVGHETTKLASCFPCTLFMYAAGYPPSAIHLGRGDSWLPWYPQEPGHHGHGILDSAVAATNARWQLECHQQLELGARILHERPDRLAAPDRMPLLVAALAGSAADTPVGANLLLDAVTVPGKISERIRDTFRPVPLGRGGDGS